MAILLKNSAFVHIPKTGGIWVKQCLESCAKSSIQKNHVADTAHFVPDVEGRGVFLFVRHPCSWLESLFSQRKYKGWNWDTRNELEAKCKANNFNKFIDNISQMEGVINRYFDKYTQKYEADNDLQVGKTESLSIDLIRLLKYFNEDFDEGSIKKFNVKKINNSKIKFGFKSKMNEEQRAKIFISQKDFYEKYGY